MELRDIKIFITLTEELHFGQTAERLRISAARVSQSVKAQERLLGVPLFERTSRRVRLTAQGEYLAGELRAAYLKIEDAITQVRMEAGYRGQLLRVGFSTTMPDATAPSLVRAFEGACPAARVISSTQPTADLLRWTGGDASWPVDVFVTWMPTGTSPVPDLMIGPVLRQIPRVAMIRSGHPLAARTTVHLEDLADHDVLRPISPTWLTDAWTPSVTPGGRELRLHRTTEGYLEDIVRLVCERSLVHISFAGVLDAYHRPGVTVRPLTGIPPMPIRPVWPASARNTLARHFVDIAAREARRIGWLDSEGIGGNVGPGASGPA